MEIIKFIEFFIYCLCFLWWLAMSIVAIRKLYLVVRDMGRDDQDKIFIIPKADVPNLFLILILFLMSLLPLVNWLFYEVWRGYEKKYTTTKNWLTSSYS